MSITTELKCPGSCCHARLNKLFVLCLNILAAYCLFIHLFWSRLQKLACRHVLFLSPFFFYSLWLASTLSAGWQLTCPQVTGLARGQQEASHLASWETLDLWGRSPSALAPHTPCALQSVTLNVTEASWQTSCTLEDGYETETRRSCGSWWQAAECVMENHVAVFIQAPLWIYLRG